MFFRPSSDAFRIHRATGGEWIAACHLRKHYCHVSLRERSNLTSFWFYIWSHYCCWRPTSLPTSLRFTFKISTSFSPRSSNSSHWLKTLHKIQGSRRDVSHGVFVVFTRINLALMSPKPTVDDGGGVNVKMIDQKVQRRAEAKRLDSMSSSYNSRKKGQTPAEEVRSSPASRGTSASRLKSHIPY